MRVSNDANDHWLRKVIPQHSAFVVAARFLLLVGSLLLLQACATHTSRLTDVALEQGMQRDEIRAAGFSLTVFENTHRLQPELGNDSADDNVLHVYLEGDGTPWRYNVITMADPTPRNPLMLRLMARDTSPAVYVGRPCYNGTYSDSGCHMGLWTSGRYSSSVVQSMASAIRVLAKRHKAKQLWLMGHSGGGALAMLLADELPQVTRVVTIAGNLDTDAWTKHHGYSGLFDSMNPATQPVLSPDIWQWHFIGGRDSVIPRQILRPVILRQVNVSGFEFPGFTHGCCWERVWSDILLALDFDDPDRVPASQFKFRGSAASVPGDQ